MPVENEASMGGSAGDVPMLLWLDNLEEVFAVQC